MCEGPSTISGPIPPDPTLFPDYYKRPSSGKPEPVIFAHRKYSVHDVTCGNPPVTQVATPLNMLNFTA